MAVALGTDARKAVMGETLSFSCEARGWDGEHTARCWWVGDGGTCQGQRVARSGHEDGPGVSNPPPGPHTHVHRGYCCFFSLQSVRDEDSARKPTRNGLHALLT